MSKLWCFSTHPELTTNMLGWAYFYLTAPCVVKLSTTVMTCLFCLWFLHYKMGLARQTSGKGNGADGIKTVPREGKIISNTLGLIMLVGLNVAPMLVPYIAPLPVEDRSPGYLIHFLFTVSLCASYLCWWAMEKDEQASNAEKHFLILRVWWVAFFLLCTWAVISAVIHHSHRVSQWDLDSFWIPSLGYTFSVSIVYLVVAIIGKTSVTAKEEGPGLKEPLLTGTSEEPFRRSNGLDSI